MNRLSKGLRACVRTFFVPVRAIVAFALDVFRKEGKNVFTFGTKGIHANAAKAILQEAFGKLVK